MKPLAPVASHAEAACARALRMLDSYVDGELSVETIHELNDHLGRCAACGGELGARQALRAAVRRVASREEAAEAPDSALDGRIRARLARTRPSRATRFATPLLLAAAVLLAAVIAFPRARSTAEERALTVAEATQRNCALGLAWPVTAPAMAALRAESAPELAPLLPALSGRLSGWAIVSAHRCEQEGEPVFHVVLRRVGETGPSSLASLLVVPVREGKAKAMSVTERRGFTLVARAGTRGTAFVVTSGARSEAMELGERALMVLMPLAA